MQQYAIAANHNNVAGLITLSTTTAVRPIMVRGRNRYNPGEVVSALDGRVVLLGRPSVSWLVGVLLPAQYVWLRATFVGGGYSGRVTVRTRLDSNVYANYNATLIVPPSASLQIGLGRMENVELLFVDLEAI